jgi:hypothetical protein
MKKQMIQQALMKMKRKQPSCLLRPKLKVAVEVSPAEPDNQDAAHQAARKERVTGNPLIP